jgi:hypothetical protein
MKLHRILVTGTFLAGTALMVGAPKAEAAVCPAFGADTDCGVIITFNADGSVTSTVTGQGPYDGIEDTLLGVVNNSGHAIAGVGPVSSNLAIFGFDGDGINTFGAPGNASDTTGYGGPNTFFTNISANLRSGTINFVTPLADGATTYFSLEEALTLHSIVIPEPATMAVLGAGLLALGVARRRRKG